MFYINSFDKIHNVLFWQMEVVSDTQDGDADTARNLVENAALSEEVNGTPEKAGEVGVADDYRSESLGGDEEEEEEEEEEDESVHPGEVSIGKKLWNFLTT